MFILATAAEIWGPKFLLEIASFWGPISYLNDFLTYVGGVFIGGKPPPRMVSPTLDRGFMMVVGDSVLGFKKPGETGARVKVFADNRIGAIFND